MSSLMVMKHCNILKVLNRPTLYSVGCICKNEMVYIPVFISVEELCVEAHSMHIGGRRICNWTRHIII